MSRMHYQRFGLPPETILWRYLKLDGFKRLIESSALSHTRLDCLGDKFEGSVTREYARKRDALEAHGYSDFPEFEPHNNRRLILTRYATCWHVREHESFLMWKVYAEEGVAIVTTIERLQASVDVSSFKHAILGPVEYFDFDRDDMMLDFGRCGMPGLSKRKEYEDEREVRGILYVPEYAADVNRMHTQEYLHELSTRLPQRMAAPVVLSKLVLEIVVHPNSLQFEEIAILAASREINQVRRSAMSSEPLY